MQEGVQRALEQIETRARNLAGGIHARGAIPARFWKRAIAERFFTEQERALDPEWAEAMIERWQPERAETLEGVQARLNNAQALAAEAASAWCWDGTPENEAALRDAVAEWRTALGLWRLACRSVQ